MTKRKLLFYSLFLINSLLIQLYFIAGHVLRISRVALAVLDWKMSLEGDKNAIKIKQFMLKEIIESL